MNALLLLLVVAVAGWVLAHFVSGLLAAIVVLIGVLYVLADVLGARAPR